MTIFHAILLSIIEGVTEFLPISSTGHLILASELLNIPKTPFLTTFEIAIQIGAVFAIFIYFSKKIQTLSSLWDKSIIAFIPTALVGFFFYPFIKGYLLQNSFITALTLIGGGLFFILFETKLLPLFLKKPDKPISRSRAFLIGCCQSLAIIPGVSRSAATIIGAMSLGVQKKRAVEFSFLLSIPTLGFATLYDLKKTAMMFSTQEYIILAIGIVGACISSLITIRWFIQFVQNHSFLSFGIYRIAIGILFLLFIAH